VGSPGQGRGGEKASKSLPLVTGVQVNPFLNRMPTVASSEGTRHRECVGNAENRPDADMQVSSWVRGNLAGRDFAS